ncbi:MAG: DoxX family protein [Gammaproteobacteria bacterium]|nr:DoxX family protein [Gammaproteobacteria bacterium]MYD79646.1 DoxX family protein [Gammaproteobacteria bacterium]
MVVEVVTKGYRWFLDVLRPIDGLGPLALRIFLAPVMIEAGWRKIVGFDSTVSWFSNMGLPFPEVMTTLAAAAEFGGGIFLIVGFCTRLAAIPLMVTMLVAAFLVHAENGWLAISDSSSIFANERVMEAAPKKEIIKDIVREHGNYRYLTSSGSITILNNGMEFAITYFVMLLALMFTGGGRYVSVDYWIARWRNIV